jgi:hypothetical protein
VGELLPVRFAEVPLYNAGGRRHRVPDVGNPHILTGARTRRPAASATDESEKLVAGFGGLLQGE